MSLPVKVWSVQSRAGRTGASLAGVAVTRGPKRRQRLDGGVELTPEIGMLWRQSWRPHQRKQHIGSRYARDRMLRRGLGLRHDQKAHSGTYEAHQRPSVGLRWGRRTRDNHSSPHRGWESDRSILSMKSPKETRGW